MQNIKEFLLGKPLSRNKIHNELLNKRSALAVLASDALSSVAYASEEIFIVLTNYSPAIFFLSIPIGIGIIILLAILTISYSQTIDAYPHGGGAYNVSRRNIGINAGLMAAAALMIDYVLTVSVSIASGVAHLTSAFPFLQEHQIGIEITIVLLVMLINLRGLKESSKVLSTPIYLFITLLTLLIGYGFYKTFQLWQFDWTHNGKNLSENFFTVKNTISDQFNLLQAIPGLLVLKAFTSGCAALTGVEAISNGVPIFQQPAQKNAKITLVWMTSLLGFLFFGIQSLIYIHHITPEPNETMLSSLSHVIFGNGFLYYSIQIFTTLILFLAANTSYADFPRLTSILAHDRFLPRQLKNLGDRLVFSNGMILLSIFAIALIIIFHGKAHALIPLYSIGVFLSFTLSQSGMVIHHYKHRSKRWKTSLIINALGALTTSIVFIMILWTKWSSGAWMTVVAIAVMIHAFKKIHKHYIRTGNELNIFKEEFPFKFNSKIKHQIIIPISGLHRGTIEALQYALTISDSIQACYIEIEPIHTGNLKNDWKKWIPNIPLVIISSPNRSIIGPFLKYLKHLENHQKNKLFTIIVPEFVPTRWFHQVLHNQTAWMIRAALLFDRKKIITTVRYHLKNN